MDLHSIFRKATGKEAVFAISVFAWLGILLFFGSLTVGYLDSVGYWGFPKDFIQALSADRGSELTGLGVRGLQLLHYSAGGLTLSALSVGLLGVKGKLSEIFPVKRQMTGNLDYKMSSVIAGEREKAFDQLRDQPLPEAIWLEIITSPYPEPTKKRTDRSSGKPT